MARIARPGRMEYPEYFHRYISLVPEADAERALIAQHADTMERLTTLDVSLLPHRYAPAKWTVREVIGHIVDVERMLAYWTWCFARRDLTLRPSVDCEAYVREARFDSRALSSLQAEYDVVRIGSLALLRTLVPERLTTAGSTSAGPITVRALAYVMAGHELHHWRILRERDGVR